MDTNTHNLHKIDRQRVSFKYWGVKPSEGWKLDFIVHKAIYYYSQIIVYAVLLSNNSGSTFLCSTLVQNTILHKRLTDKEWCSSWDECSQKYGRPYLIFVGTINNHFSLTVEVVWIQKKCNHRE